MNRDYLAGFIQEFNESEGFTKDNSICTCPCHNPGAKIMHTMPCCTICPACGKNIRIGYNSTHITFCNGNK